MNDNKEINSLVDSTESENLVYNFANKGINVLAVERKGSDERPGDVKESSSGEIGIKFE